MWCVRGTDVIQIGLFCELLGTPSNELLEAMGVNEEVRLRMTHALVPSGGWLTGSASLARRPRRAPSLRHCRCSRHSASRTGSPRPTPKVRMRVTDAAAAMQAQWLTYFAHHRAGPAGQNALLGPIPAHLCRRGPGAPVHGRVPLPRGRGAAVDALIVCRRADAGWPVDPDPCSRRHWSPWTSCSTSITTGPLRSGAVRMGALSHARAHIASGAQFRARQT
jgi:hypothetical protein